MTSTPIDEPTRDESEMEGCRKQGDEVVQRFGSLITDYHSDKYLVHPHADPLPYRWSEGNGFTPEALDVRRTLLKKLESNLLPLLRQQITSLSKPLDRLRIRPGPSFNLILEIQSEIDKTTNQIEDTLNELRTEHESSRDREDDQDLAEFKYFRTTGLDDRFVHLLKENQRLYKKSQTFIQKLQLSTNQIELDTNHIDNSTDLADT
ncbi:hypothetical protein MJO28_006951 [Puccinia striiformis f. sp. tritici]|uniref:Uncharacterized protein n=2 Tax=Puccinia striiformis f. sp. tritici TaxID=168172 RepID=A0A0L0VGU8_9BASI|nr:hypothetical protein Pst134EA_013065 [Puccinia striiformis f. sp. tritici]KAI9621964.1 hypothetical protein H4Q26_015401 [Puccinia striiformis f. sp. tritici PST-130]KNE98495.1 hypothetical protein PSTG_08234 [Puccinia striiformis f. sp. tritici PST-78]KAH9465172.1 hypothetical protein Pst134EA_013065 [Puccinia striiformis f. sp. tritici]KAI7951267.1 hypothetical protein MJO28_006951 [Puccinia striiformis f. sp. tritici]KAI7955511.1 hypothetical protein MJO29_006910 [Puccinia striiformis f.